MAPDTRHELPDTLHELLELAIADANNQDRTEYFPDSGVWHSQGMDEETGDAVCFTCLAGSVIAGTLNFGKDEEIFAITCEEAVVSGESNFTGDQRRKLVILDALRDGRYIPAYRLFYGVEPTKRVRLALVGIPPLGGAFYGWAQYDETLGELTDHVLPVLRDLKI